jgi:hypothetical protein
MAEYYAVLSKAVAGLEPSTPESRRAVYDKARNALIGQLKAIDPPLPTAEISRQRLELEEAIRRVERETAAMPPRAPARAAARPAAAEPVAPAVATPPPPPASRAAPVQTGRPSPKDIFRRAIQEAERDTGEEPKVERAPAPAAKVDTSWASERIDRVPPPARPAETFLPSQGYVEVPRGEEPKLAPDYDQEWEQAIPVPPLPGSDTEEGEAPGRGRRGRRGARGEDAPVSAPPRQSRLPTIILLVLIVAMIGGLGALAWSQRDVLADLAGGMLPSSEPTPAGGDSGAATATTQAADDGSSKDTGRLLAGAEVDQPATDVRTVTPASETAADAITEQVAAAPPLGVEAGTPVDTAGADPIPGGPQRAVLYEEPLDAAAAAAGVIAINASVTWSYEPNGINGPEIVGNIQVPERALKIRVAIRRNTDDTLPASHIVEVVTDTPTGFPGGAVRDVPRIVFKPSEDARGQPLIGASARVANGFFWIALSGVDSDVRNNLSLLKDRIWIDLPLVYQSGQRAILTFEKGAAGEQVFERALTAWNGSG